MELRFYNTLSRHSDVFVPLVPGLVKMYCCGPTVYNFAHIGNLRTYVFEDILHRSLRHLGYRVTHVMNITDVGHLSDDGDEGEDKMIKSAREKGMSVWDIAGFFTDAFFNDAAKLNILRPQVVCRATDHIQDMINMVKQLEARGLTYQSEGNVYYDTSRFPHYDQLARLDRQDWSAGNRVETDLAKRNPRDFVLWFTRSKFAQQAMVWDSPWGRGYPGWHIECSAMSHRYLGDQFDIHCGGVDHIQVHHTNEIAQTEGACGTHPWVRYWLHAEFLNLNNAKMSKSTGGFLTLSRLEEEGWTPSEYRYFLLGAHYRTQLVFRKEAMEAARSALKRLVDRTAALLVQVPQEILETFRVTGVFECGDADKYSPLDHQACLNLVGTQAATHLESFAAALSDDLNVSRALACVWDLLKDSSLTAADQLLALLSMDQVLGLGLLAKAVQAQELRADARQEGAENPRLQELLAQRQEARKSKDWARADAIRGELATLGYQVIDGPQGPQLQAVKV